MSVKNTQKPKAKPSTPTTPAVPPVESGSGETVGNIPPIVLPKENKEHWITVLITKYHSACYCAVIFLITILFGAFLWCSNSNLKKSQSQIISTFELVRNQTEDNVRAFISDSESHRENMQVCVDKQLRLIGEVCRNNPDSSAFMIAGLYAKLNADINELRIQNEAVSRIAIDSLSRKYEALINYQVTEKMLDLHLSQVEHEYTSITIWAAVLTIIFLIFSFYSLFKIEQSREEIRQLTIRGKETSEYIASQLQYQNNSINNQVQTAVSNLSGLKEEYESKIEELNSRLQAINVKESSVQPKMEE